MESGDFFYMGVYQFFIGVVWEVGYICIDSDIFVYVFGSEFFKILQQYGVINMAAVINMVVLDLVVNKYINKVIDIFMDGVLIYGGNVIIVVN